MNDKLRHIVGAKGNGEPTEDRVGDQYLFRTSTWQLVIAPDDPGVFAIFAMTACGQIGLEFPRSEARELARQLDGLAALATREVQ
jgi:hypothetical protein